MSNIFDTCGLQAVLNVEAEEMISSFDEVNDTFNSSFNSSLQLNPFQVFVSKDFLQRLMDQMEEKGRNCTRMRLGRKLLPGGETRLAWMMQTLQADLEDDYVVKLSEKGPWFSSASGEVQQTEPPGTEIPPYKQED